MKVSKQHLENFGGKDSKHGHVWIFLDCLRYEKTDISTLLGKKYEELKEDPKWKLWKRELPEKDELYNVGIQNWPNVQIVFDMETGRIVDSFYPKCKGCNLCNV